MEALVCAKCCLPLRHLQVWDWIRVAALITDGRFSGVSRGASIGHVSPEAAAGGLLAFTEDGDMISIDIPAHKIELCVDSAEITRRKQEYTPKMLRPVTGYLKRYRALG